MNERVLRLKTNVFIRNLFIVALGMAIWILGYYFGCVLANKLDAMVFTFYVIVLWFFVPALPVVLCWQGLVKYKNGKLSTYYYGFYVSLIFLLWVWFSFIMGLGPCYRYMLIEAGYFGQVVFYLITLPLLFTETAGNYIRINLLFLMLIFSGIGFILGTVFASIKSPTR